MDIAIVGAGNVGGDLASAASTAGDGVVISASTPSSAQGTTAAAGVTASGIDFLRGDGEQAKRTASSLAESLVGPQGS